MYRPKNVITNVLHLALLGTALGCAPTGDEDTAQSAQPIVHCRYDRGATEVPFRASGLVQCVPVNVNHCPSAPDGGPNADDCTPVVDVFDRLPMRFELPPVNDVWVSSHPGLRLCDVRVDGCGPFWLRPDALGLDLPRGASLGRAQAGVVPQGEHPEWVDAVREQMRVSGRDVGLGGGR